MASAPNFPQPSPGNTIIQGHCKGQSRSAVKSALHIESDRYLEVKIAKPSGSPLLQEWKCKDQPPAGTDPKNVFQLMASTQVIQVSPYTPLISVEHLSLTCCAGSQQVDGQRRGAHCRRRTHHYRSHFGCRASLHICLRFGVRSLGARVEARNDQTRTRPRGFSCCRLPLIRRRQSNPCSSQLHSLQPQPN